MKILIVEDDGVLRELLERELGRQGHSCQGAPDGRQAFEMFSCEPAEVVVSDWSMPGMSGLELCEAIRQSRTRDYIYFILVTSHSSRQNYLEAMERGVDDFLSKPVKAEDLNQRLRVAERILTFNRQIGKLKELLPICMYCKKIRHDGDYWQQIESYIHQQTGSDFTHGVCPDCYQKEIVPQIEKAKGA